MSDKYPELRRMACKACGQPLTDGDEGNLCPDCADIQRSALARVVAYLHAHPGANALDVVRETGVSFRVLNDMMSSGRVRIR